MVVTLHGLKTCDSCRRAKKYLESKGLEVVLRDVRNEPLMRSEIDRFLEAFGDRLINRRSTTWRSLSEAEKTATNADLLSQHPTLMKRPIIDAGGNLHLGWDEAVKRAITG